MELNPSTSLNQDDEQPDENECIVDQTAIEIADILGVDVSGCSNAEEGTETVVDAVYNLIEQNAACARQNAELQQMVEEMQTQLEEMDQEQDEQNGEVDENGQPIEPEVDENGNPVEDDPNGELDPQQQQQNTNPAAPPQQDFPKAPAKPAFGQGKKPAVAVKKKPQVVAPKKQAIAASFGSANAQVAKLFKQNRDMKIERLAASGIITGEIARELRLAYTSPDVVALSLSGDSIGDDKQFDLMLSMMERNGVANGPVIRYGESELTEIGQSPTAQQQQASNPLVADAERRAREAEKQGN